MRLSKLVVVAAAAVGLSCSGTTKFNGASVNIHVTADPSFASSIKLLHLVYSGTDSSDQTVPVGDSFASSGAHVSYTSSASSGTLQVAVTGVGVGGVTIALGSGTGTLMPGVTTIEVALTAAPPPDMAVPVDLAASTPPDLSQPPAMAITPSHVVPGRYDTTAEHLEGVISIDTTNLIVKVSAGTVRPDGGFDSDGWDGGSTFSADGGAGRILENIKFAIDGNNAVLSVGSWTVDKPLVVTGTRPLVVVAAGPVIVNAAIAANAVNITPGPGGLGPGAGNGHGNAGLALTTAGSGGGGAGYGTAGAPGGGVCATADKNTYFCMTPPAPGSPVSGNSAGGGTGGATHDDLISNFVGGSGGGNGGSPGTASTAGAGGGAIQISSGSRITITINGTINAGGGAGQRLCYSGGSGGGSGGTIFLEARQIDVTGVIAANGGAGGHTCSFMLSQDGQLTDQPARTAPWTGYPPPLTINPGGNGGAGTTMPTAGLDTGYDQWTNFGNYLYPAGGGGGAGRIWLRVPNGTMPSTTGIVSPAPQIDTTLQ
jgi:hypothetical protein